MISRYLRRSVSRVVTGICLVMAVTTVHAHLIVEQHGTVNFANGGAFLVLSAPVSAFDGVDDNGDGQSHVMVFIPDREYHTMFPKENLVE